MYGNLLMLPGELRSSHPEKHGDFFLFSQLRGIENASKKL